MKLPSVSRPSGQTVATAVKATYYTAVVAALVGGVLAAHGLLGHSAFATHAKHFMNVTLPSHLSPAYLLAAGFGAGFAPTALKALVKGVKATKQHIDVMRSERMITKVKRGIQEDKKAAAERAADTKAK